MESSLALPDWAREKPPSARLAILALREADEPLTVAELAETVGVQTPAIQKHLDPLVAVGLVRKGRFEEDRRRIVYSLPEEHAI